MPLCTPAVPLPRRLRMAWAALCCCLLLSACLEARLPEGVVATVNGEAVHLRSLQALLDGRSAALGALRRPSLENMKRQYGDALGTMIIYALVRQELQGLQIPVSEAEVAAAADAVKEDYGGSEGLARFLADESLNEDEWRALLRDHLSLLAFEKRVLLPGIRITLEEARTYYAAHENDFQLPEIFDACLVTGQTREAVEDFCRRFAAGDWLETADLLVQCRDMAVTDLPPDWRAPLTELKEGQCAAPRRGGEGWQGVALVERRPAARVGLAEVYALVENILREQKRDEVFEIWLEASQKRADIRVSAALVADLLTPPSARPALPGDESNSSGQDGDDMDGGQDQDADAGEEQGMAQPPAGKRANGRTP